MSIWKSPATLEQFRERPKDTLMERLGIEYLEIGDDYLKARMPVDARTRQTAGISMEGLRSRWPSLWEALRRVCASTGRINVSSGSK
jgi:hypothetical protein